MRNVRIPSVTLFFHHFTWFSLPQRRLSGRTVTTVRTSCITELSCILFSLSFLSPFAFTFYFLSLGFYPFSLLLPFPFSPAFIGRTVWNSSGEHDRGARFLLLTFCTPIFVLHANLRSDKARFHGELCRLVMEDSSFSNATQLSSTPTYCRLLPLLSSHSVILCLT